MELHEQLAQVPLTAGLPPNVRRRLADTGIRLTQLANSTSSDTSDLLDHARTRLAGELETSACRLRLARPAPPRHTAGAQVEHAGRMY